MCNSLHRVDRVSNRFPQLHVTLIISYCGCMSGLMISKTFLVNSYNSQSELLILFDRRNIRKLLPEITVTTASMLCCYLPLKFEE